MNRSVRKLQQRRCALKANNNYYMGGGLTVSPADTFESSNGVNIPENINYSECYDSTRPGALQPDANPDLAQTAMAGGRKMRLASRRRRRHNGGGCGCSMFKREQRGGQCGLMRGGQCEVNNKGWLGGRRRKYTMRGGNRGFMIDPQQNIGGDGPIAEPTRMSRAGFFSK